MTYQPTLDPRHCDKLGPWSDCKYVLVDPTAPRTGERLPDGSGEIDGGYYCCRRKDGRLIVFGRHDHDKACRAADRRGAYVRVQSEGGDCYEMWGDDDA